MLRQDFQVVARLRTKEARTLLRARLFDGAYYLGGLALECALKACIARATQRYEFPDRDRANRIYSHKLEVLLKEANLQLTLQSASAATQNAWAIGKNWQVDARYQSGHSAIDVEEFLDAVDGRGGVLQWLRQFW